MGATRSCKSGCRKRTAPEPVRMMPGAVILKPTSFGLATLCLIGPLIAVTSSTARADPACHRCGRRVRLERRVCRHWGCEFEQIRFGR